MLKRNKVNVAHYRVRSHCSATCATCGRRGKEAGLELEDVKTLLRHEDIATTSNIYGDLGMDAKRRNPTEALVAFVNQQARQVQHDSSIEDAWAKIPVTIQ